MKKHVVIIITLLLALSSCNSDIRRAKRYCRMAQEVYAVDPDSTIILIDSVLRMEVYLDDAKRMNLALLQSEATFEHPDGERRQMSHRVDVSKIYTMPELNRAPAFFAKKKHYHKAAYAAIYCGYEQKTANNKDKAIKYFVEAERYGSDVGDSLAVFIAKYNMARLLMDCHLTAKALPYLIDIEPYPQISDTTKARILNMMVVAYIVTHNTDSAYYCLNKAQLYAEKSNSSAIRWMVMNNFSVFYRQQCDFRRAVEYLRRIEPITDSSRLINLYLNMGKAFMYASEYDSAAFYYHKVASLIPNDKVKRETLVSAYDAFSYLHEMQNDYQKALEYRKKHDVLQYELQDSLRNNDIYLIQRQYDYEIMQNAMNRRIIFNQRIEIALAVFVIIALFTILVLYHYIIQKNKKATEMKAALLRLMRNNETLIQNQMENVSEKLRSMQRLDIYMKDNKDKFLLVNLEKEMFGDKNHWEVMTDMFNTIYPGLYDTLKEKYPDMNEFERRVYLLNNFKLSRIDEALLLDVSISVLDKARGKVKKLIEQENLFDTVISTEE